MLKMTLKEAKGGFLDRKKVVDLIGKKAASFLARQGGLIRTIARRSIRRRKGASKPGKPPYSHVGLLRDMIFFSFGPDKKSVVVGPAKLERTNSPVPAPGLLEHGGSVTTKNPRRKDRKIGDYAPVDVVGKGVVYGIIKTQKQVERAERIDEFLYGPKGNITMNYPARPYMGPALAEAVRQGKGNIKLS